jgi:nitrite reductase (NO-forming)/hydroxylamine reductase
MRCTGIGIALSTLAIAVGMAIADTRTTPSDTEMAYQAAPSAVNPASTKDMITGEGPPMTKDEFEKGKEIFFQSTSRRCLPSSA